MKETRPRSCAPSMKPRVTRKVGGPACYVPEGTVHSEQCCVIRFAQRNNTFDRTRQRTKGLPPLNLSQTATSGHTYPITTCATTNIESLIRAQHPVRVRIWHYSTSRRPPKFRDHKQCTQSIGTTAPVLLRSRVPANRCSPPRARIPGGLSWTVASEHPPPVGRRRPWSAHRGPNSPCCFT